MAKGSYSGFETIEDKFYNLARESARRIVNAGSKAAVQFMKDQIVKYRHVGSPPQMLNAVKEGPYSEFLGGGKQEVYPQGTDSRGVSNAMKAFVINYGYGGRKTARTGDKFITGNKKQAGEAVHAAMAAENEKILREKNS